MTDSIYQQLQCCISQHQNTASIYLSELRDFAIAQDNPELLNLISKSQNIVEEKLYNKAKQAKITDFFPHGINTPCI